MSKTQISIIEKTLWTQSQDISEIKTNVINVTKNVDKLVEYHVSQVRLEEKCKSVEKDIEEHKKDDIKKHEKQDKKIEEIEKNMWRGTGALAVIYSLIAYLVNKFL